MQEIEGGEPDSGTKRANVRSRSGDGNKSSACVSAIQASGRSGLFQNCPAR